MNAYIFPIKNIYIYIYKTHHITSIKTSIFFNILFKYYFFIIFYFSSLSPLSLCFSTQLFSTSLATTSTHPYPSHHIHPPSPPPATSDQTKSPPTTARKRKGKKPTNHSQIGPQPIAKKNPQTKSTKSDHYSFDPCSDPCSMVDHQAPSEHQCHQTQIDYPLHSNPTKSHHLHSNATKK